MGVYGYVEAKGLDQRKEIKVSEYESQVERYLVLENPVILTDGIDFVLFTHDGKKKLFSLCKKPIKWKKLCYGEHSIYPLILLKMDDFTFCENIFAYMKYCHVVV